MAELKQELIELIQNDREVVFEFSRALDIDMLESEIDIIKDKLRQSKRRLETK